VFLCTALLVSQASGPAVGEAPSSSRSSPIERYIDRFASDNDLPGLAISIRRGDRGTTWFRGHDGNGRRVGPDTSFLLGSVSKSFTATAAMSLVAEGQLRLTARVSDILPWFPHDDVLVRDLLQHTSGYEAQAGLGLVGGYGEGPAALGRAAHAVAGVERTVEPGDFAYSSANYLLLGAVIESASHRWFARALERRVLAPLGLEHTAASVAGAQRVGLPPGHRVWWGLPRPFERPYDPAGAPYGYVASTLPDTAAFLDAHARGAPEVLPDSERMGMQSRQVGSGSDVAGRPTWYGFGWRGGRIGRGIPFREHTGATPGYFAHVLWLPGRDVRVVLLTNLYTEARAPALAAAARDLALMAAGEDPVGGSRDSWLDAAPFMALGVSAAGGLAALRSIWLVVRSRSRGPTGGGRQRIWAGIGSLAAALVATLLWCGPRLLHLDFRTLRVWAPDLAWSLLTGAVFWMTTAALVAVIAGLPTIATSRFGRHSGAGEQ
jgi:CubicO group peptidase (beta-lactamase class C family)